MKPPLFLKIGHREKQKAPDHTIIPFLLLTLAKTEKAAKRQPFASAAPVACVLPLYRFLSGKESGSFALSHGRSFFAA